MRIALRDVAAFMAAGLIITSASSCVRAQTPAPLPESNANTVGYATPAAALEALRTKPGVEFSTVNGWTVASDRAELTVWSFAPASDPSYPSAVRRAIVQEGGKVSIKMSVQCMASKTACDAMVREFMRMNGMRPPS